MLGMQLNIMTYPHSWVLIDMRHSNLLILSGYRGTMAGKLFTWFL